MLRSLLLLTMYIRCCVPYHMGKLIELINKKVPGSLDCKTFNDGKPEIYFKATAWLDGAVGIEEGRSKREAEQRAAKARGVHRSSTRLTLTRRLLYRASV